MEFFICFSLLLLSCCFGSSMIITGYADSFFSYFITSQIQFRTRFPLLVWFNRNYYTAFTMLTVLISLIGFRTIIFPRWLSVSPPSHPTLNLTRHFSLLVDIGLFVPLTVLFSGMCVQLDCHPDLLLRERILAILLIIFGLLTAAQTTHKCRLPLQKACD